MPVLVLLWCLPPDGAGNRACCGFGGGTGLGSLQGKISGCCKLGCAQ